MKDVNKHLAVVGMSRTRAMISLKSLWHPAKRLKTEQWTCSHSSVLNASGCCRIFRRKKTHTLPKENYENALIYTTRLLKHIHSCSLKFRETYRTSIFFSFCPCCWRFHYLFKSHSAWLLNWCRVALQWHWMLPTRLWHPDEYSSVPWNVWSRRFFLSIYFTWINGWLRRHRIVWGKKPTLWPHGLHAQHKRG